MTIQQDRPAPTATAPMTGDEYISSIQDGREVWVYGERVKDVTTHPAFRNPVRMTARLYDALHAPETRDKLTVPTDTGNGGVTHPFFRSPHTVDDLLADRQAIETWSRMSYGWMGRSPDYAQDPAADVARICAVARRSRPSPRSTPHCRSR